MPKRKVPASLLPPEVEAAALASMREALSHPRLMTQQEEADFLAARARGLAAGTIGRNTSIVTERAGRIVYREPGKAGADYPVMPFYWRMLTERRDFEAQCAKVRRRVFGIREARAANQSKAQACAERIREIARTIPAGRGKVKAIARAAGVDVRTVRRVLRESRTF